MTNCAHKILTLLCENGVPVNHHEITFFGGTNPLQQLLIKAPDEDKTRTLKLLNILIKHGEKVNLVTKNNHTALTILSSHFKFLDQTDFDILSMLLSNGANLFHEYEENGFDGKYIISPAKKILNLFINKGENQILSFIETLKFISNDDYKKTINSLIELCDRDKYKDHQNIAVIKQELTQILSIESSKKEGHIISRL